jgi:NDP-mannose synthase
VTDRHAVILAGGKGTRLRPYTTTIPKPLVPIGDESAILEIVLRQLAAQGFRRVTIAIGHLGELIRAYVGAGGQWGLEVDYAVEDTPLGTIGPVVTILARLPEHFLVLNGDILTDLPYAELLEAHSTSGSPLTIATYKREVQVDFGVLEIQDRRVIGFSEKPILHYDVSMGVYALSRATLGRYRPGQPLGFDELVLDLLASDLPPMSYAFEGYWLDIGRPDDYDLANAEFGEQRARLLPER